MSTQTPAMSDLVQRAREYATRAHERIDQRRKYSGQPYQVHLEAVADTVARIGGDEEMIAAAWLHDTVEDTPATHQDIEDNFGPGVAQLVRELTDVSRPSDGPRAVRKALDREHLAQASDRAQTIKLADLIDNAEDICQHDERFARTYLGEMAALLEVLDRGHPDLRIAALSADRKAGRPMGAVFPHLAHLGLPDLVKIADIDFSGIDLAFLALPHGVSHDLVRELPGHVKVVDLSADFRLRDGAAYRQRFQQENRQRQERGHPRALPR